MGMRYFELAVVLSAGVPGCAKGAATEQLLSEAANSRKLRREIGGGTANSCVPPSSEAFRILDPRLRMG